MLARVTYPPIRLLGSQTVDALLLDVCYDDFRFDFQDCFADTGGVSVDFDETFDTCDDGGRRVEVRIGANPPRTFNGTTLAQCQFEVTNGIGCSSVSLAGTLTDAGGTTVPVSGSGQFDIDECASDLDCSGNESCEFRSRPCDPNVCVAPTATPPATPTPTPTIQAPPPDDGGGGSAQGQGVSMRITCPSTALSGGVCTTQTGLALSFFDSFGVVDVELTGGGPVFGSGTVLVECSFAVEQAGGFGGAVSGVITQAGGATIPFSATGTLSFQPECTSDFDCFGNSCVANRCVTPTPTVTATGTVTPTATGTPTPTPTAGPGPVITYFGLLGSSAAVLSPVATAPDGAPIFQPAAGTGAGFYIVIEAGKGPSDVQPSTDRLFPAEGRPDLEIQADRDLGNGTELVCDTPNGIPGIAPPSFADDPFIDAALLDFSCRFEFHSRLQPCQTSSSDFISRSAADAQLCTRNTIQPAAAFPSGDTRLTARWRDDEGNVGNVASIVVRVP